MEGEEEGERVGGLKAEKRGRRQRATSKTGISRPRSLLTEEAKNDKKKKKKKTAVRETVDSPSGGCAGVK